jgi:hypothetical protein
LRLSEVHESEIEILCDYRSGTKIWSFSCLTQLPILNLVSRPNGANDMDLENKSELKKQISELKGAIAKAIGEKNASEVKTLRRRVKRLKAGTRRLARAAKPPAAPAPAAPSA